MRTLSIVLVVSCVLGLGACGGGSSSQPGGGNNAPTISSIQVTGLSATGTYSDASTQDLTSQVTWTSTNTSVASISTTVPTAGLASAVSAGTTTITATLGSVSGNTLLAVTSATVTQITVTAGSPTLTLGLSQQYTATATFSDGSTQDVTNVAQWHSSSGNIASITVSGFATARLLGTTT